MVYPFPDHITNEDINQLDLLSFQGEIHLIESEVKAHEAISRLSKATELGFDTEKKPTFQKGEYNHTAMVQLSTESDAYLFRLNKIGYLPALFNLLSDGSIIKYGISIDDDIKALQKCKPYDPQGFIDINDIANGLDIRHIGVKKLAAIFLHKRVSKNQQTSNWEVEILTEAQMAYAATDAWICLEIIKALRMKGFY